MIGPPLEEGIKNTPLMLRLHQVDDSNTTLHSIMMPQYLCIILACYKTESGKVWCLGQVDCNAFVRFDALFCWLCIPTTWSLTPQRGTST